jgi:hypothetical protein
MGLKSLSMEGNSCEDAVTGRLKRGQKMDRADSPLLTDLYQLTMMQAYLDHGKTGIAVFEFFMRKLPANRRFLLAAGLEQALGFLENLRFPPDDLEALRASGRFSSSLIDYLAAFRFTGDVHAMPEGNVFFPEEPILRVTAPLPEAQLVETRLINILHFQTLIASKAARHVLLAPGKILADFWPRAQVISPDILERRRFSRACASAFRYTAPWRIPSSSPSMTRPRLSRPLRGPGPRALPF